MWKFYIFALFMLVVAIAGLGLVWLTAWPEIYLGTAQASATSDRIGLTQVVIEAVGFILAIGGFWFAAKEFAEQQATPKLDFFLVPPSREGENRVKSKHVKITRIPSNTSTSTIPVEIVLANRGTGHAVYYSFTLRDPAIKDSNDYQKMWDGLRRTGLFSKDEYWSIGRDGITFLSKGEIVCPAWQEIGVGELKFPLDTPRIYSIEIVSSWAGQKKMNQPQSLVVTIC